MVAVLAFVGTACSRNQSTRVSLPTGSFLDPAP
jgi:hypothetical protein